MLVTFIRKKHPYNLKQGGQERKVPQHCDWLKNKALIGQKKRANKEVKIATKGRREFVSTQDYSALLNDDARPGT
jgi:hypothetical protein